MKTIKSISAAALALSLAALPVVQDMPVLQGTSVGIAANAAECAVHNYDGQVSAYKWSMDNSSCTASVKCSNCDYVLTSDVSATFEITENPTAAAKGKKTCEASFNAPFETQYKFVDVDNYSHVAINTAMRKIEDTIEKLADEGKSRTYDNRITESEIQSALDEATSGLGVTFTCEVYENDHYTVPGYYAIVISVKGKNDEGYSNMEVLQTYFRCYASQNEDEEQLDASVEKIRNTLTKTNDISSTDNLFDICEKAANDLNAVQIYDECSISSFLSSYCDSNGRTDMTVSLNCLSGDTFHFFMFVKMLNPTPSTVITENGSKIATAKNAVNKALINLDVNNDTSETTVQSTVNTAIASSGVTGVSGNVRFTLNKATDKTTGSAAITVTLTAGNENDTVTQNGYVIAKLTPTISDNLDAEKAAAAKSTLTDSWLAYSDQSSWLKESDLAFWGADSIASMAKEVIGDGADVTCTNYSKADSDGNVTFTINIKIGSAETSAYIKVKVAAENKPAPTVTYYIVGFTGDYAGSGVTLSSLTNAAGSTVTVNVPVGYSVSVMSGGNRIASISDGTGTFTMPEGNVTLNVSSYLGTLTTGYKNAYIYSYDSEMNHITTNSVRGGMQSPEGEVTVKLGKKYAGKTVTLYNGRKSTSSKADEATLDSKGQATFTVKSGKNYTLVVK